MGKNKLIIIGGGASGIVAAISAARRGMRVTILERCDRIGKKILATGNGRCNLTNLYTNENNFFLKGKDKGFIQGFLEQFGVEETIVFFNKLGIEFIEKEDGKLYPRSEQANSILSVLMTELEYLKVEVKTNEEVKKIEVDKNIRVYTGDNKYYCNNLIISAGGHSSPNLGSNGSGFKLAEALGHTIVPVFPSLVQLKTDYPYLKHLKGTKIQGKVSLLSEDRKIIQEEFGEILYTDYGVSGPPVLQISRTASYRYHNGIDTYVTIDLIPEMKEDELEQLLINRFNNMSYKTSEQVLVGLINNRLIIPLLKMSEIAISKKVADITKEERKRLIGQLKETKMKINGINPWSQSQVTGGGISLKEINNKTLESLIVKGVYFCGEILDIDGICGGFNLQWAWSSGYISGKNAAMEE